MIICFTMNQPIFITGAERSGSSLIARIFSMCGAFTGVINKMYENVELKQICHTYLEKYKVNNELICPTKSLTIPINWKEKVDAILLGCECYKDGPWMFKDSQLTRMWPVWHFAYPNAKWVIVRRKTPDIIHSCVKTSYMKMFKDVKNCMKVNAKTEQEGWLWWIHEYEKRFVEMIEAGVNIKQVWPERMVTGDYQQIYETLEWLGLPWDYKIVETIDPLLTKSRRNEIWLA